MAEALQHSEAHDAVIPVGARFRGLVLLLEPARVEGRVEGAIVASESLAVGAAGCVIGPVEARDARVSGRIEGDLRASDRLVLEATAHVRGEISAPRLVLREGSFLEGNCQSGSALAAGAESPRAEASGREHSAAQPARETG